MIETDSPYCEVKKTHDSFKHLSVDLPKSKDFRKYDKRVLVKGRNEPCRITEILDIISSVISIPKEIIAEQTFLNSQKIFKI